MRGYVEYEVAASWQKTIVAEMQAGTQDGDWREERRRRRQDIRSANRSTVGMQNNGRQFENRRSRREFFALCSLYVALDSHEV